MLIVIVNVTAMFLGNDLMKSSTLFDAKVLVCICLMQCRVG